MLEPHDTSTAGAAAASDENRDTSSKSGNSRRQNSVPILINPSLFLSPSPPSPSPQWGGAVHARTPSREYEDELPMELIVGAPRSPDPANPAAEPNTPPPNYHGDEAPRSDSPLLFVNAPPATSQAPVVPPARRAPALARSALLSLRRLGGAATASAGTHSPPPTYPSPPRYITRTPPAIQGGAGTETEMADMSNVWMSGYDRDFESREPLADETAELAPAYRDDVSFFSGVRRTRHVACFVLTICLYALIALYVTGVSEWLTSAPRNFQVVMFAMYAVYAIESFGCATSALLWGLRTAPQASEYFYKMMDAVPFVKWTIRCYHLKRPVEAAAARPNDKVVTYNRSTHHELHGCADDTPLRFFTSHQLCLYTFEKSRRWRDAAAETRYEEEKAYFIRENSKDDHYDIDEYWGLEEFEDSFLAVRPGGRVPWWASWQIFMLFVISGLSLFYRIYFASRIGRQKITFKKIMW